MKSSILVFDIDFVATSVYEERLSWISMRSSGTTGAARLEQLWLFWRRPSPRDPGTRDLAVRHRHRASIHAGVFPECPAPMRHSGSSPAPSR